MAKLPRMGELGSAANHYFPHMTKLRPQLSTMCFYLPHIKSSKRPFSVDKHTLINFLTF